jgi:hypothetical protein
MIRRNIRPASVRIRVNLQRWKNCLRGEPAFIIGNGPSAGDEDLSPVRDYFTVGINRAFLLLDPAVLFWQDAQLFEQEREKVLKCDSVKVCRDIADPQGRFHHFRLRGSENFRLTDTPAILYGTGATGPLAFQFAYAMGCDPIVLIGYDCKYRNAKTDFYGVNPNHKLHTLRNCTRGLQWIANLHTERLIVNCSDNTVLSPRQKLSDVVAEIAAKPLPPKGKAHYASVLSGLAESK